MIRSLGVTRACLGALILAAAATGVLAATASAATVAVSNGTLVYQAAPGEKNNVTVGWAGGYGAPWQMTFQDTANITSGSGCVGGTHAAVCDISTPDSFSVDIPQVINLGNEPDTLALNMTGPGVAAPTINGGDGNDRITGWDRIGADVNGGGGDDFVDLNAYDPYAVYYLTGGPGNDTLTGHGGQAYNINLISGGDGKDAITGSGTLLGGGGNDTINAYNGLADNQVDCGPGSADTATIDVLDQPITSGCESVFAS